MKGVPHAILMLFASHRRLIVLSVVAALMVLPVLLVWGIEEFVSDPGETIFLAILLSLVALAYEIGARLSGMQAYYWGLGGTGATVLGLVWINGAVGIIGSDNNPANLIYSLVVVVVVGGALAFRLRPQGMARTMIAAAIAQVLVFVIALAFGWGFTGPITVFFAALWLIWGWLFSQASPDRGHKTLPQA